MPTLDLDSHHEVLGQDESGERDANHVNETLFEQQHAAEHDHTALIQPVHSGAERGQRRP
jgi:hypothetical protein